MSLVYKRLGAQGEIHLTEDSSITLCDITCTHANWIDWLAVDDKYPQLCVDCLENRNKDEGGKEEPTKKAGKANKVAKSTKIAKKENKVDKSEKPKKKGVKKPTKKKPAVKEKEE